MGEKRSDAAKRRVCRVLLVASVGLTLAASSLPAQAIASGGPNSSSPLGHKITH